MDEQDRIWNWPGSVDGGQPIGETRAGRAYSNDPVAGMANPENLALFYLGREPAYLGKLGLGREGIQVAK